MTFLERLSGISRRAGDWTFRRTHTGELEINHAPTGDMVHLRISWESLIEALPYLMSSEELKVFALLLHHASRQSVQNKQSIVHQSLREFKEDG